MGKRDAQRVTQALYTLIDAREAIANGHRDAALNALDEAHEVLASVEHAPGVSVAAASEQLGVSEPTVRNWVKRGALRAVSNNGPMQIEAESLHRDTVSETVQCRGALREFQRRAGAVDQGYLRRGGSRHART